MKDTSVITLNETSLLNNIQFLKKKLGSKVTISSVVKANAYGHGIEQMVPMLERAGINHFSVFDYAEALRVYKNLVSPAAIVIMGYIADSDLKEAIVKGMEFFIFNEERLTKVICFAQELKIKAKIHLEAETGMNRLGLNMQELKIAISAIIENSDCVEVVGFCTHLAGAESITNHLRIQKQLRRYQKMFLILQAAGINPKFRHVANSAAAFVYPKTRMNMVRIGIMQYGFWSSTETFIHFVNAKAKKTDPLQRILGWKSTIMTTKVVHSGEFVNYGISYLAQTDIKIALVPVGYANGFSRSLSNRGRVLIHGYRCSVIGVVNMNMIVVDITNVENAAIGDEVVIIGKQGDLEIKVSAFSDISNKLNYEVLASLPEKITRKIIK